MIVRFAIACVAALFVAGCAAPVPRPASGPPACFATAPPPDAGEVVEDGAKLLVHPRARELAGDASGCQSVWIDTGTGPTLVGRFWYEHGRYIAYSAPLPNGREATLCRYHDSRLTQGDAHDCESGEVRPIASMAPGCFAVVRHSAMIGQPIPARCRAME